MKKNLLLLFSFISMLSAAQTGIQWGAAVDVAPNGSGNLHPRLAVDAAGNPMVVWGKSGTNEVYFSKWNGTSFTSPLKMNPTGMQVFVYSWGAAGVAASGDSAYIVVKEMPEATGHVFIFNSYDGGNTFSGPVQVENIGTNVSWLPTVTTDVAGNPIVAFMKLNSAMTLAQYVIAVSNDGGNTFLPDVQASGHSGGLVCDCCPATPVVSGNTVAVLYRDNLNNLRNMWAGISNDNGNSFGGGMQLDNTNWMITSCPASGPDGVIINDTLYSVYMSQASGTALSYYSKSVISSLTGGASTPITGAMTGLSQQNFPRIANDGNEVGITWRQTVNGQSRVCVAYTNDITTGFPLSYDTIAINTNNFIINADILVRQGTVHVVWQDAGTATVKYVKGEYVTGIAESEIKQDGINIYPNPFSELFHVSGIKRKVGEKIRIIISNITGKTVAEISVMEVPFDYDGKDLPNGVYALKIVTEEKAFVKKIVKQ